MKTKKHLARWLAVMLVFFAIPSLMAQGPGGLTSDDPTQDVCLTGIPEPYAVVATINSTYTWTIDDLTVSPDWTLNSTNTNEITIIWINPGTYTVQVVETNSDGCDGPMVTMLVTVHPLPVITLTGLDEVCLNSENNVYTTEAGMDNYVWTVVGGTVTSGGTATDNTVTITWDGATGPYSVSVNYEDPNGCGATDPTELTITVNPLPVITLTGSDEVCLNSENNVYTTEAGMDNYVWTVVGGTVTSGGTATDNTVTITWDGAIGPYSVSVNYEDPNGCGATDPTELTITVNPLPVTSPIWHD